MYKFNPPQLLPNPTHYLNKLESSLPEDASAEERNCVANWFLMVIFLKIFLYIILCYISTPLLPNPTLVDHDLSKPELTLTKDAYTQVTACLANRFCEDF